jgi:hypothetical protein
LLGDHHLVYFPYSELSLKLIGASFLNKQCYLLIVTVPLP